MILLSLGILNNNDSKSFIRPLGLFLYNNNMKFNLTYSQKINLRDTIKWINHIEEVILKWAKRKFNLMNISVPQYLLEDSPLLTSNPIISRNITFDSIFENRTFSLNSSASNILRYQMDKMNFKEKEGLITKFTKIRRDIDENPITSISREEIVFQFIINKESSIKMVNDISKQLYKKIYSIAIEIEKEYNIKNILPEELEVITSQELFNEYPDFSKDIRLETFIMETDAFILKGSGVKKFSGESDKLIESEIYDLVNYNEIYLRDTINNAPIHIATIARLASGKQLDDQLQMYEKFELKQYKFYNKLVKQKNKVIEVSISIPAIAMAILAKAHISETQPGVYTEETSTIENKYKVEVF